MFDFVPSTNAQGSNAHMSLFKGFRHWFNQPSLLGLFTQSNDDAYTQRFFESQVKTAVRYRQVQAQPLSPTHYLSEAEPELPSSFLTQSPLVEVGVGQIVPASLGSGKDDKNKSDTLQNGTPLTPLSLIMSGEANPTVVSLFLDQAQGYVNQGLWDKAIATCQKTIALDPQRAEAHRLMGKTLHSQGQTVESIGYYADALILQPESVETYTELGHLYCDLKEWKRAITYYQKAVDLSSSSSAPVSDMVSSAAHDGLMYAQGQIQRQVADMNQKVDAIYQSLSLSPETFTAEEHCEMGLLLLQQEDRDNAMECFQRAIDCQPSCAAAHVQLGLLLEHQQRWQDAMFHYKQAIQHTSTISEVPSLAETPIPFDLAEIDTCIQSVSDYPAVEPDEGDATPSRSLASPVGGGTSLTSGPLFNPLNLSGDRLQGLPRPSKTTSHKTSMHRSIPVSSQRSTSSMANDSSPSVIKPLGPTPLQQLTAHRDASDPLVASIQAFVALARSYGEHGDLDKAITHYRNALSLDPKNRDIHQELTLVLDQQTAKH